MIPQVLRQLGLNTHEIDVYLAILQNGKISATDLSKATKINRTTVYSIAKQLIKRGIITEDLGSNKRYFLARPPEDLDILLRRQEHDIEEKRYQLQNALGELTKLAKSTQYSIPKIVFIEEDGLRDYLYKQTKIWNKSLQEGEPTWWGFQDPTLVADYQEWIDWYWQEANPEDVDLKLLTSQANIEESMKEKDYARRHLKFWDKGTDFTATVWICGNYLIMIMTSQHPHYLVEIYDKTLAHNMREVFKATWNSLPTTSSPSAPSADGTEQTPQP